MNNSGDYGRFGPLLGVIYIGNIYCQFLVYAAKNAEVLTFHEVKLQQICFNPGWLEIDSNVIWKSVITCIEVASKNLIFLDINPMDIIALGICNQRGTTVLWNRETGSPLSNAIDWTDLRTSATLNAILHRVRGNKNYLKSICGLPFSTCFSALKIKWLNDNVQTVHENILNKTCLFGTLDSWLIWNLTGGIDGGIHVTDVTNASYTMLMNLKTLQWDKKLCKFFNISEKMLPRIKSCSEIYGYIHNGPLRGVPIASCMGDQPAALLGQLCLEVGQSTCTVDESCFILFNTGQEIVYSYNGLLSIIAFQLGPKKQVFYALEGIIANAGSSINWLQNKLQINTEIKKKDNKTVEVLTHVFDDLPINSSGCSMLVSGSESNNVSGSISTTINDSLPAKKSEVLFIPAFNGLYSPYWRHDARGVIFGINNSTTAENITQATYEATGFQVKEVLDAYVKDTKKTRGERLTKLIVGGEFSENYKLMQFMSDVIGISLEHPQTTSPSCLGVMLAAGTTMGVLAIDNAKQMYAPPSDTFYPTTTINRREILYSRWQYAVKKCLNWDNFENYHEEMQIFSQNEKIPLPVRKSISGALFFTTSFILLLVSKLLQDQNIY